MQKFGLIGYPLGHSFSPEIHKLIYELNGINATYSLIEIKPEELNNDKYDNILKGFEGLNVTIPYKTEITKYLDNVSEEALHIGAVNTLKNVDNKWIGHNTDSHGFLFPLKNYFDKINTCVIIGTGGAAKAVIYALIESVNPKKLVILGRNKNKAKQLELSFAEINKKVEIHSDNITNASIHLKETDLLVNATSVGMHPNIHETVLPEKYIIKSNVIVYDLIYNPLETQLLKKIKKTYPDSIMINGIQMLIAQAVKAVELWTGKPISIQNIIDALDISKLSH